MLESSKWATFPSSYPHAAYYYFHPRNIFLAKAAPCKRVRLIKLGNKHNVSFSLYTFGKPLVLPVSVIYPQVLLK